MRQRRGISGQTRDTAVTHATDPIVSRSMFDQARRALIWVVVRGRAELPTFRFQGGRRPAPQPLAEVSVADAHPARCSIVSAESAVSRPSRTRSLREP